MTDYEPSHPAESVQGHIERNRTDIERLKKENDAGYLGRMVTHAELH